MYKYFSNSFNASEPFTLPKIKCVLWTSKIRLFLSGKVGIKKTPIELYFFKISAAKIWSLKPSSNVGKNLSEGMNNSSYELINPFFENFLIW